MSVLIALAVYLIIGITLAHAVRGGITDPFSPRKKDWLAASVVGLWPVYLIGAGILTLIRSFKHE